MYILLAILIFGILIASHELGHFLAAKSCGVKVNEFAIGMGPAIFKKQGKETLYALRALPIGGFCAMEGEDEDTGDPRSFSGQKAWKKFIILIAGAGMNFIFGLIIILIIYSGASAFGGNTVQTTVDGFKYGGESGIMAGDEIVKIDGSRIYYSADFSTYMSRSADGKVDMEIIRDGEKIQLRDFPLSVEDYVINGQTVSKYGITFEVIQANVLERVKFSFYTAYNFMRYVQMGLSDLITGAVGVNDMSGVVGIVSTINQVGESADSTGDAIINILYFGAFIAINLAVMNLLPIPALDGGRIFFLIVTWITEKIIRRKIDPKYEGYIHMIGLVLLMGLMIYVMFNDILRIVNG